MSGIYIHIPFCKQACHYCDFHFSTSLKGKADLVKALVNEIHLQKNFFGESRAAISTIYFGGGTPSLLDAEELNSVLNAIRSEFNIDDDAEFTLEANPDDLTKERLHFLRRAGINRLSIGVQSFDDADLKWMHRAHSSAQATDSIKHAQDAGFSNITIDLIYGTPLLTDQQWEKNMLTAFGLNVQHLSCYALTVEERTALAHFIAAKKQPPVEEAKQARHFEMLMEAAAANGFEQYEISNFARDKKYSKHNSSYWTNEKYLGIGPSAHSYNQSSRQWNVRNNIQYVKDIASGKIPSADEILTPENKYNEYIMTALRTKWGCDPETIRKRFGEERAVRFSEMMKPHIEAANVTRNEQQYVLTQKGKLLADRIAASLFI